MSSIHPPHQVKQNRLYQQVASEISRSILGGAFRPGDRLPAERELAAQFGVARPTIREALIALEISGLVTVRTGSGVYVTERSEAAMANFDLDAGPFEITEARLLIEGETAALAARLITPAQLEELGSLLNDMAVSRDDEVAGHDADRAFHVLIARATGNAILVSMVEHLWDARSRSALCTRVARQAWAAGVRPQVDEHMAILDALKRGDAKAARKAMRHHLTRVIESLLEATEVESLAETRRNLDARRKRFAATES